MAKGKLPAFLKKGTTFPKTAVAEPSALKGQSKKMPSLLKKRGK